MLSIPHLIIIFIVALVVFGPEKIPELARNLGKIMAEFRRVTGDLRGTFEGHLRDLEREADQRRIAPAAAARPASVAAVPAVPSAPAASEPTASPAPATVPSNPPNAAAVAPNPEAADSMATENVSVPAPGDPMYDPYLGEWPPRESGNGSKDSSDPDHKPERVTDGDRRPS
jgi:sec-independent protein translocase protein TatB